MSEKSREEAWALLTEYTASQALRRHAVAVEASMRHLARSTGITDPAEVGRWGMVGLLHDFDYERFPTEADHVWRGMEVLRERGFAEEVVAGVGAHTFYTNIPHDTPMKKAIVAADELTGFLGACALIRKPSLLADVTPEFVLKRLKEKSFARTVDRAYVHKGAELWGLPLPELIALLLAAQRPLAARLGLAGAPAPELPDSPAPPEPEAP